jgi:hypothetical protein
MAIIQLINGEQLPECMRCVICDKQITPDDAVAGLLDADNQQQFACNGHFWSPRQFITGWADFMATQRVGQTRIQFVAEYGVTIDARFMR